jgi:hypothetical protein
MGRESKKAQDVISINMHVISLIIFQFAIRVMIPSQILMLDRRYLHYRRSLGKESRMGPSFSILEGLLREKEWTTKKRSAKSHFELILSPQRYSFCQQQRDFIT